MIPGRRLIAALLARLERRLGLPELRARQSELVALANASLAQANRLEAAVGAGFSAAMARADSDRAALADRAGAISERLAGVAEAVRALQVGLATLGERLGAGLAGAADETDRLGARLAALAEAVANLHGAVGGGFGAIDARLESVAQAGRRLEEGSSAGFAALGERLESAVAALAGQGLELGARVERDLAILAAQIRQLGDNANQLAEVTQTLDRNVAQNFTGIGRRLETDLTTLGRTTHDLVESSRHVAGTLAKFAAERIAPGGEAEPSAGDIEAEAPDRAPLTRLETADLPEAIRAAIAATGLAPSDLAFCLDPARLPRTEGDLPRWLSIMTACRAMLRAGDRLVWAQPVETGAPLADGEVEQVIGLLGAVDAMLEARDGDSIWRIAIATRRVEGAGVALRWSSAALEALHMRLAPLAGEMLRRYGLEAAAHAVDLPEPDADLDDWVRLLPSFAAQVAAGGEAPIGVVLPAGFAAAEGLMDKAVVRLRAALRDNGGDGAIAFQWVRGSAPIARSGAILDFARRNKIAFDFTPVSRGAPGSRLAAYDDRAPYRALSFDLRLPSARAQPGAPIEIARWPGRALHGGVEDVRAHPLDRPFARDFDADRSRLARVLDRAGQRQFERQANSDATLVAHWPEYFVFNWAPPALARLRLFEFDAGALFDRASPLAALFGRAPRARNALSGLRFLAEAARVVAAPAAARELARAQVDAHAYLRTDRPDITAESERLIAWMPERLGVVVELGSGFGVMARRVAARATRYLGLDLTLDQAAAMRALGGAGLVADIHRLPFGEASVDTIIADNVIEHAADPLAALLECHRVLRPGGRAYLAIPHDYRQRDFRNPTHLWKADAQSVEEALGRAGLRIVRRETVRLAELGVSGAYPSSDGETGLWQVEKPNSAVSRSLDSRREEPGGGDFDLASASAYWRFAPSGVGKHDTAAMLRLGARELVAVWDAGFAARFRRYPEEEMFLRRMAAEFAGKRVLSIGSGLGLHEIYYRLHGAEVTCCDIVESNLAVVARVAAAKGADAMRFICSAGPDHDLGGPYDFVFVYGSLMTMPEPLQRRLAARCLAALAPGGAIVLMLYAWEFARATCGWSSPEQFDPRRFARASDPSVGEEHCPWSDWHDFDKLRRTFGGALHVARRQFWNQGWFFWCELRREKTAEPGVFFAPSRLIGGARRRDIDLDALRPVAATAERTAAGLVVATARNSFGYALASPARAGGAGANAILVDAEIEQGAFSVGLLDVEENCFAFAQAVWQPGRGRHVFAFDRLPARFQLIVSNHRPDGPEVSRFVLHRLAMLDRPGLVGARVGGP
ncbi:MAG: methyltransferase domain-containing protein [Roseiarcus sp.]